MSQPPENPTPFPEVQTLATAGEKPEVVFKEEVLVDAGTPFPEPASETENPKHKIIWISVILGALLLLAAFGGWVWFEYQRFAVIQNQMLESESTLWPADSEPENEEVIATPIETSPLPTLSPLTSSVPVEWVAQEYSSNEQVVWQLSHPPLTTANQAGLHEGYLGLTSEWDGNRYELDFSYPLFANGLPATFDQWVTDFITTDETLSGDVIVEKQDQDGVLLRIVKNGSLENADGEIVPATLVFIWSHTNDQGQEKNPALIMIKQTSGPIREVETFSEQLIQGLIF